MTEVPEEDGEAATAADVSSTLRDSSGFELEAGSLLPVLHSNRNKMDPYFGRDGVESTFSGYLCNGLVEEIEAISPEWPSRIVIGEDDGLLELSLSEMVSLMEGYGTGHSACASSPRPGVLDLR
jgi:hypothetical protein